MAQRTPGGQRRPAGPALSVVITSIACGKTSPVALCRELSIPLPIGLVRLIGSPARPASMRSSASGSASPVTAMPYLGSGSSMLCPPASRQPACRAASSPPRSTSPASSTGSVARGQPSRFSATSGVPPTAYTSDSAFVPAIRPNV